MTLIEVMIAVTVLTVTVYMLMTTIDASASHSATRAEQGLASNAARNLLEEMHALSFTKLFATYNHDTNDDPNGPKTAPGAYFDVEGLQPLPNNPNGHVGEVILPSTGSELREDANNQALGMPRDLNGDSLVDNLNHATDYLVLPVAIQITWKGKSGKQTLTIYTMFSKLMKQ